MLQEDAEDRGDDSGLGDLRKIENAGRTLLGMIDQHFGPSSRLAAIVSGAPDLLHHEPAIAHAPDSVAAAATKEVATFDDTAAAAPRQTAAFLVNREAPEVDMEERPYRGARLLVVDDNEMNRDMLARRLERSGFAVDTAEDGEHALVALENEKYQLVVLDVMMPGLSGIDVLRIVRKTRSQSELPIVMATAKHGSDDIVEALSHGANDYVTKPIDYPVALARLEGQLHLKAAKDRIDQLAATLEVRNRFIRQTFGRYLSDEIVESLLEKEEGLALGGERRIVTILMSDIRGFSSIAERLPPEQVVAMLNIYLGRMADIVLEQRGTIDEFIGDSVLAIFGAPVLREDDAERAMACALSMQLAMAEVNSELGKMGLSPVEMGIAINTGEVVVGNIGSDKRAKYGVVGSPINLTSRIEGYTVGGQILVADSTLAPSRAIAKLGAEIAVNAKGYREPVIVHDLQGLAGRWNLVLPEIEEHFQELDPPLEIAFAPLEGKQVGSVANEARLVALSEKGAELATDVPPKVLANLKLYLVDRAGTPLEADVYAKVQSSPALPRGHFRIRFTSVPPAAVKLIDSLRP